MRDLCLSRSIIRKSRFFYEGAEKNKTKERMILSFKRKLSPGNDQAGNEPHPNQVESYDFTESLFSHRNFNHGF